MEDKKRVLLWHVEDVVEEKANCKVQCFEPSGERVFEDKFDFRELDDVKEITGRLDDFIGGLSKQVFLVSFSHQHPASKAIRQVMRRQNSAIDSLLMQCTVNDLLTMCGLEENNPPNLRPDQHLDFMGTILQYCRYYNDRLA